MVVSDFPLQHQPFSREPVNRTGVTARCRFFDFSGKLA
jgi:hypothetical protein